jgi:hypothetical protein
LHRKNRVPQLAAVVADLLVGDFYAAHIAFVLHLDEVDIDYYTADLHDVSDDHVGLYGLEEGELRVGLEFTDLVPDLLQVAVLVLMLLHQLLQLCVLHTLHGAHNMIVQHAAFLLGKRPRILAVYELI